jgi:GT2 family glycosyltransferase
MADYPKVSVIILNYNGLAYLKNCLASLRKQTYSNVRVIVCDNASKDGSVDFVTKNYPDITLIKNKENFGFAKGNNIAINYALAQGDAYIFLLNNDAEMEPDALNELVKTAELDDSIGIVGSRVFDLKNRRILQEAGMSIDKFGFPMSTNPNFKQASEVFFVSGCSMLIKRVVLQNIGVFDNQYFMFAEDLDLCWRAQLAGYKIVVSKTSKIYHASGGSMVGGVAKSTHYKTDVRRIFLREKNTLRTLLKNYGTANMVSVVPLQVALQFFEAIFWFFIGKPQTGKNILKAIVWNLKAFPDTMHQRVRVQNLRKIPDREITNRMAYGYLKLNLFKAVGVPDFAKSK